MTKTIIWTPGLPPVMPVVTVPQTVMQRGYTLAPQLLTGVMQQHAPQQLAAWRTLQAGGASPRVLVVRGQYDQMQDVLRALKIPHALVKSD